MSYTTGGIVTKVQQRIRDTGHSSTEIKNYINDTQNDVFNEYRLPFMETSQAYTMTPGTSDITAGTGLPANYVQAIDLTVTTNGQERVVEYKDIREIDNYHPDADDTSANTMNTPSYWYYYAQTIKTYPVPDAAYTLSLRYYKKPTILSGDDNVPEIPSEFEELLVVGAAYRVMQVKDNYDQATILQNRYDELLQKLVSRFSQVQVGAMTQIRTNRKYVGKANF